MVLLFNALSSALSGGIISYFYPTPWKTLATIMELKMDIPRSALKLKGFLSEYYCPRIARSINCLQKVVFLFLPIIVNLVESYVYSKMSSFSFWFRGLYELKQSWCKALKVNFWWIRDGSFASFRSKSDGFVYFPKLKPKDSRKALTPRVGPL